MAPCARRLADLPTDIVEIIAKFSLPYDVVHLSSTCKLLRPIFHNKSIWLQVSDAVSYSRPLPYTANEAMDLPASELRHACMRAERVAKKWAMPEIEPRKRECVRISFPDKRIVSYFSFIPGCRHLMVYDLRNVLSCWTVDGRCLVQKKIFGHAVLTRWKPSDEYESTSWELKPGQQAIQITFVSPRRPNHPTRYDTMQLVYSSNEAKFIDIGTFFVPGPFEPFSALSQGDLHGALVIIPGPDHVGIHLTCRKTKRAICVDTGLNPETVPQALISSQYMVLYWESSSGAHTYMYEIEMLIAAIERLGVEQGDPQLEVPVHLPACEIRNIPFFTITGLSYQGKSGGQVYGSAPEMEAQNDVVIELAGNNNLNMTNNWDWFPVIIPKWTTLRENLRQHRIRSIMTLSRSTLEPDIFFGEDEDILMNGEPALPNIQGNANGALAHGLINQQAPNLNVFAEAGLVPQALHEILVNGAPELQEVFALLNLHLPVELNGQSQVAGENGVGTVVEGPAETALDLHEDEQFPQGLNNQWILPPLPQGAGIDHIHTANHAHFPPAPLTTITHHYFDYDAFPQPTALRRTLIAEVPLRRPQNIRMFRHIAEWIAPATAILEEIGVNEGGDVGAQLGEIGDPAEENDVDLVEEQLGVFGRFVEDPLGGSPVMGYGGCCAMWVEEHERQSHSRQGRLHPIPVMKVVTFPAFEKPVRDGSKGYQVFVHHELEVARGKVCTLIVPDCVDLDTAYSFDLDDIGGIVGIATSSGEIVLVDYS